MFKETNQAVVKRFNEYFNKGDLDQAVTLFDRDAVIHNSGAPDPLDVEGFKRFGGMFRKAFPDGELVIEDLITEGDEVVSRVTYHGTNTGEMMGIPPTGKAVVVPSISIDRFSEGKIVESWRLFDQMGMMQQLGLMPPQGQAG